MDDLPHALISISGTNVKASAASPGVEPFKFIPLLLIFDIYKAGYLVMFTMLAIAAFYRGSCLVSRFQCWAFRFSSPQWRKFCSFLIAGRNGQFGDVLIEGAGIAPGITLQRIARLFKLVLILTSARNQPLAHMFPFSTFLNHSKTDKFN